MEGNEIAVLKPKKTVFGFTISDLCGIALMIIPVVISCLSFNRDRAFLFIKWKEPMSIAPDLISMGITVVFYAALIVRYGIFRKETLAETLISVVRTCLNCWAIAALLKAVITTDPGDTLTILAFQFNTFTLLLFAIILSWIGMKTLAGYSWIFFIFAGVNHMGAVNKAMGGLGAVFILAFFVSLLLQINDFSHIGEFMSDFRNATGGYVSEAKGNITDAANDISVHAQNAAETVKDKLI